MSDVKLPRKRVRPKCPEPTDEQKAVWRAERQVCIDIAEKIFGHTVVISNKGRTFSIGEPDYYDSAGELLLSNPLPRYDEDMAAAWEIVKAMNRSEVYEFELKLFYDGVWFCNIQNAGRTLEQGISVGHITAPLAICEAALKAVGYTD